MPLPTVITAIVELAKPKEQEDPPLPDPSTVLTDDEASIL